MIQMEATRSEGIFSLCCCFSTLGLGLFSHYTDYKRSIINGKPFNKITVDVYGSILTLILTLVYVHILFVEGADGSISQFERIILGDVTIDSFSEKFGRMAHSFLLGYMIQDIIARYALGDVDFFYLVHHIASICGILLCLVMGQSSVYCAAVGISEFSTPLVGILSVAKVLQMDTILFYGGLLLNIFWPLRAILTTWLSYKWSFYHIHSPLLQTEENGDILSTIGLVLVTVISILNWIWYTELIKMTLDTLRQFNKLKSS